MSDQGCSSTFNVTTGFPSLGWSLRAVASLGASKTRQMATHLAFSTIPFSVDLCVRYVERYAMSTVPSHFVVPPDQYAPFAVVTDNDHRAWIIICTALGLACVLVFGALGIFDRATSNCERGPDEAFLAAATCVFPCAPGAQSSPLRRMWQPCDSPR